MTYLNFDARTVVPLATLENVPTAWYKVTIERSNIKPTKGGDNGLLELIMTIQEGAYQGRKLWWNLNLFNTSQQSQEIAYKQLSAICHVTGQYHVVGQATQDGATPMLHNIPFFVHAVNDGQYTNIKGCKDIHGNDPGKQANQPSPLTTAPIMVPGSPSSPAPTFGAPPTPIQPQQFGQAGGTAPPGYTPQVATPAAPMAPGGAPWSARNGQDPLSPPTLPLQASQPPASMPLQQIWPMQGATTPAAPAAAPGQPWQQNATPTAAPPWVK